MGPTVAYIAHKNLQHNIRLIRQAVGQRKIMAVVKANAYGHGDIEVARTAVKSGCEYLGVAFVEEGVKLRLAGIEVPILVFGAHDAKSLSDAIAHDLDITVTSDEQVDYLAKIDPAKQIKVHLKLDTGMNRIGINYENFTPALEKLLRCTHIHLQGVYSHFATADETDNSFARLQLSRFTKAAEQIRAKCPHQIMFHMANSAAIMTMPEAYLDMVRPGIMLYGQLPSPEFDLPWDLNEVLTFKSALGLVKSIKKNEPVSYGRRYYTQSDTHIGIIPVGYADGFNRRNTNIAQVEIDHVRYPVVGTVCMDMTMIDLGKDTNCKAGDPVTLYGGGIPVNEVAARLGTIAYEVTCNLSARVPRIHLYE